MSNCWLVLFLLSGLIFQLEAFSLSSSKRPSSDTPEPAPIEQYEQKSTSVSVDHGFIAQASYLFYQAMEDGLDFIQSTEVSGGFPGRILADAVVHEPTFHWKSGFQVGLGYIFSQREQWDLFANWTWYHGDAHNSASADFATVASRTLRPVWLPFLMGTAASEASVDWRVHFNTVDLSIGRDFFIGRWLSMHPRAGFRGGWITQRYHASYNGAYLVNGTTVFPLGITSFDANWHYHAGGLRMGSDAQWYFSDQFSFVANLYGSILYGKFKMNQIFDGGFVIDGGGGPVELPETIFFQKEYFRLRPVLEAEVGLKWQRFFHDRKRKASIGAYYGFSYWFNQNVLINEFLNIDLTSGNSFVTLLPLDGSLQLQGLRVEAALEF